MPDFDVEARGLAVPPVSAPVAPYRPAVLVRNNGIHPADVSGTLRVYQREPPGELLGTFPVSLANLAAGAEGDAQASQYWIPTAADVGKEFLFAADVTTANDQVEKNNHLSPVTVLVTGAEPPPPPAVTAHAIQHEHAGADQIEISGLHGLAGDAQTPLLHKTRHQAGGDDSLSVDGLPGRLLEGQPIADHNTSHEYGGGDRLWVGGLRGVLADNQPAILHDNAKHNPNYTSVTEFNNHLTDTTAVHAVATNLEQVARKGISNGYAGLGANALVPVVQLAPLDAAPATSGLRKDQAWGNVDPTPHHVRHEHKPEADDELDVTGLHGLLADPQQCEHLDATGAYSLLTPLDPETIFASLSIPDTYKNDFLHIRATAFGRLILHGVPQAFAIFRLWQKGLYIATVELDISKADPSREFTVTAEFFHIGALAGRGSIRVTAQETELPSYHFAQDNILADTGYNLWNLSYHLSAGLSQPHPDDLLHIDSWIIECLGQATPEYGGGDQ